MGEGQFATRWGINRYLLTISVIISNGNKSHSDYQHGGHIWPLPQEHSCRQYPRTLGSILHLLTWGDDPTSRTLETRWLEQSCVLGVGQGKRNSATELHMPVNSSVTALLVEEGYLRFSIIYIMTAFPACTGTVRSQLFPHHHWLSFVHHSQILLGLLSLCIS